MVDSPLNRCFHTAKTHNRLLLGDCRTSCMKSRIICTNDSSWEFRMSVDFITIDRETPSLLPASVQDYIPQTHLARFIAVCNPDHRRRHAGRYRKAEPVRGGDRAKSFAPHVSTDCDLNDPHLGVHPLGWTPTDGEFRRATGRQLCRAATANKGQKSPCATRCETSLNGTKPTNWPRFQVDRMSLPVGGSSPSM